ncbi:MAG: alpha/beta hydrolase [Chloroflexi bacterium]|nr:alpha/beta hydrolase [Chloroflexota bacterium]
MSTTSPGKGGVEIPTKVNYVSQGKGQPVIMIHGLAASLHDWDFLIPELDKAGYASYALDLLGHGGSPKPDSRSYQMDWLTDHFLGWIESLGLEQPTVLIGHSLGGYFALEYARRFPSRTRGLILVDPFYSCRQLPVLVRWLYRYPRLISFIIRSTPTWLLRIAINFTSISIGHGPSGMHGLPKSVRKQALLDYSRTAYGVYNLPNTNFDLTPCVASISAPSLIVWGEHDQTLSPSSFSTLAKLMPNAKAEHIPATHIPHQTHADWFNGLVLDFLKTI